MISESTLHKCRHHVFMDMLGWKDLEIEVEDDCTKAGADRVDFQYSIIQYWNTTKVIDFKLSAHINKLYNPSFYKSYTLADDTILNKYNVFLPLVKKKQENSENMNSQSEGGILINPRHSIKVQRTNNKERESEEKSGWEDNEGILIMKCLQRVMTLAWHFNFYHIITKKFSYLCVVYPCVSKGVCANVLETALFLSSYLLSVHYTLFLPDMV